MHFDIINDVYQTVHGHWLEKGAANNPQTVFVDIL